MGGSLIMRKSDISKNPFRMPKCDFPVGRTAMWQNDNQVRRIFYKNVFVLSLQVVLFCASTNLTVLFGVACV